MSATLLLKRGTAAQWIAANPILNPGEPGVETDSNPMRLKIGDGVNPWVSLPYIYNGSGIIQIKGFSDQFIFDSVAGTLSINSNKIVDGQNY